MAYIDLALLAADGDFWQRTSACAASEMISGTVPDGDPQQWATENRWTLAAQPGFADAYAYALQTGVEHPGLDQGVISDAMLLSAVQTVAAEPSTE